MNSIYFTTLNQAFKEAVQYNADVYKGVKALRKLAEGLDPMYTVDEVAGEFETFLLRYEDDIMLANELTAIVQELLDEAYFAERIYLEKNN